MRLATTFTLALALIGFATPADATVARFLSLEEHVAAADAIVRVRVAGSETFVHEDDGRPRTDTRVRVLFHYKGMFSPADEILVRQMRGSTGETELRIPGDPPLRDGEEVILFLKVGPDKTSYLTALAQSKYEVVRDLSGIWVKRDFDGLGFVFEEGGDVVDPAPESPTPLELFDQALLRVIEQQKNQQNEQQNHPKQ